MKKKFYEKDKKMGVIFLLTVFIEEVGELSRAIRKGSKKEIEEEISDVFFTLISIANLLHVKIEPLIIEKYVNRSLNEISHKWTDVNWK
ncbi:MAG: MazG nucleotide pyrophosphohydrolase domain-containing protein [Candidatus Bathyarchaeia archaeon]